MNWIHRIYCRSPHWGRHLSTLLPWATEGVELRQADVLELGSGPGLTTDWLRPRSGTLTALEQDADDAAALARRLPDVGVHHGDASAMPFTDASFDVVTCFTMLHHVPSRDLQDRLITEVLRVLRPGGSFVGSDSRWGPLFALAHLGDTLQIVQPDWWTERLRDAGFTGVSTSPGRSAFRFHAIRPRSC